MSLLRLGISSCLRGENVRHNGGHKRDRWLAGLGDMVEWVPICPEVEIGLGVPRPTIRLEYVDGEEDLVMPSTGDRLGAAMDAWAKAWLAGTGTLHGFVLKRGSPSCGLQIKVWQDGDVKGEASGRFTRHIQGMPIIDEGRMQDPASREHFFDQAMALRRWQDHVQGGGRLSEFHAANKLTFMSHDPRLATRLGRIAAGHDDGDYAATMQDVLAKQATRGRHANVLQHIQGFLELDATDKATLGEAITDYQQGLHPLIVPLTLLRHHIRRQGGPDWLLQQTYLEPYPKEWMLRNLI